jgi:flagellar hook assembly protein FlgD
MAATPGVGEPVEVQGGHNGEGMHIHGVAAAGPVRVTRSALVIACISLVLIASSAFAGVTSVRAATTPPHSTPQTQGPAAEPARLKAVIIVGPAGSQTGADLQDAESFAQLAESYGMDVRRVFHPHATWDAVMANVQGANLVVYMGHGNGWPSPYTPYQERTKNGVGLNPYDGAGQNETLYYGANQIRASWVLAPNALVFLNHDCYTAGNGEPGMAIPSWDVARQRVDNFAASFLAVGARAVFAYSWQKFNRTLTSLFTTDETMEQVFMLPGYRPTAYYGWIGSDPRKFPSERTPGATIYMDPDPDDGFLRAITGDLNMTATEWSQGAPDGGDDDQAPALTDFATGPASTPSFATSGVPVFTPNGDGVTDEMDLTFTVDREAFVDLIVTDEFGDAVRTFSAWSAGGGGSASWNGKTDDGDFVPDGTYSVTATPRNRAGTSGNSESVDVRVMTTMSHPSVTPDLFYAADGDAYGSVTNLSVTLDEEATFWWKIADEDGTVVRTYLNGVATSPGTISWDWDGRNGAGDFVAEGMYYSVTTTATAAGMSSHALPVEVGAFRVATTTTASFAPATKTKLWVASAEPLLGKPRVRVTVPGFAPKTYKTKKSGASWWFATLNFPATAQAGTVVVTVFGTDAGGQSQYTDYYFQLE